MSTSPSPHRQLGPRPVSERIPELISRVDQGDIKLPTFQRSVVWNVDQVVDFLDSVNRGFPIGSLLLWLTHQRLSSERSIGGFPLPDREPRYPTNYVLDGQQRITTLYAVLTHEASLLDERFRVAYDLAGQQFVQVHDNVDVAAHFCPLHVLNDTRKYLEFQRKLDQEENSAPLMEEADRLFESFRGYSIPVITIDASIDHVGVIFERINSTGTRLTIFDLMVAATWQLEGGGEFNLKERVDTIIEQLDEKDYGDVEDVTVLRCISVVSEDSARRQTIIGLRDKGAASLRLLLEKTRGALTRAVDFLATELSAKSNDFLPYERQLVLLAYVMARRASLTASDVSVLQRWFWRTSFSERYRTGGEARFDEDLAVAIKALDKPADLARYGDPPSADFFVRTTFRKGAAAAQAFATLLGFHKPRNLTNGAAIDVGVALSEYNSKEFHHIFPRSFLKEQGVATELINSLANICMLSASENKKIGARAPSQYVAELKAELGEEFDDVMQSNLIPPSAVKHMMREEYAQFLEARSEHLADTVNGLL